MTWDQYVAFVSMASLFISINVLHWQRWRATIDPVNKRIADMDKTDREAWARIARNKRLNFRRFTMNKHKLNKTDQMKCPTCDHVHNDAAKDFVKVDEGWENGATDVCDACGSEMYCYQEDGYVYVEEV